MPKEIEFDPRLDPNNIRSRGQYEAAVAAANAGCAWCMENQPSPILKEFEHWVVRKNAFPKPNRDMYIIHLKRHAHMKDIMPEEWAELGNVRNWIIKEFGIKGGGIIHRFGDKKLHAGSMSDEHYFEMLIAPTGEGPVAESLVKNNSPEEQARRDERSKTFVQDE